MRLIAQKIAVAITTVAVGLGLTACGGGSSVAAPTEAHGGLLPARFDAYATGSVAGDIRNADVYGITFTPLRAYRLTVDKRISYLSADPERVVVAAADQGVDLLGQLGLHGQIVEIPGFGRPHAFGPELQHDGTVRFSDDEGSGPKDGRYLSWDPATSKTRVLHRESSQVFGGTHAGPGGQFVYTYGARTETGIDRVVVVSKGRAKSFDTAESTGGSSWGARFISVRVLEPTGGFGPATGLLLLDPGTGKRVEVPGWSPIAWSPDGNRLLVQRTGGAADAPSELAVLDPENPTAPRSLGTVPYLTLYQGSWIHDEAPAGS